MKRFKILFISLLFLAILTPLKSVSADSNSCLKTSTRYASSSNSLYILGGQTSCTPANLSVFYPTVVVQAQQPRTFLLRANLVLQQGATFVVEGGTASTATTDELRLKSNNDTTTNNIATITADYGTVRFTATKVTSWDETNQTPDYEYGSTYKRANVKVRSRFIAGIAYTSRMDITDSEVSYLGYSSSESYGLAWRVMDSQFANVDVLGDIRNSHIHHNYFGVYTFGAYGMTIDNNEFNNNVKYGLDPHDDSDYLVITNNRSHDNGNHGIICSQRCDHLLIKGNQSYNNIGHGIMLHRSSDYSTIEDNIISNNTDTGIALFESNNNTVRNNTIVGNKNGIRLSVGASFNSFYSNSIQNTLENAIYTYKGSDLPTRGDGINRSNIWTNNVVSGTKNYVMKLGATDGDVFDSNDFRNNLQASYNFSGAANTIFMNNQTDPGVLLP